ncbi:class III lanthipeptide [Nonomuraea sp. NPDC050536]
MSDVLKLQAQIAVDAGVEEDAALSTLSWSHCGNAEN